MVRIPVASWVQWRSIATLTSMREISWTDLGLALGSAAAGALLLIVVVHLLFRFVGRRWAPAASFTAAARTPFRILVLTLALNGVILGIRGERREAWWQVTTHAGHVLSIVAGAWLLAVVLLFFVALALREADLEPESARSGRGRTQMQGVRRLVIAVVAVVATGAVLFTFEEVRAVGASVLASAGLISVVAALAAQSTLANVFAGMQLAFSDALRINDVVVVAEEYGHVEEITLSYVVIRTWDTRRVVLPCTYFTTNPFQNWTRRYSSVLGTVSLELDWRVDVEAMRWELSRILHDSEFWDRDVQAVQVVDAVGGMVHVRASMTAATPGLLWDLRCQVREKLVAWVRDQDPDGLPRVRVVDAPPVAPGPERPDRPERDRIEPVP